MEKKLYYRKRGGILRIWRKYNKTFLIQPESSEDLDEVKELKNAIVKGKEGKWSRKEREILKNIKKRIE